MVERPVYGHPMEPMQLPIPVHPGYGNMYDQNFLYGLPYNQGYPVYQQSHPDMRYSQVPPLQPCPCCIPVPVEKVHHRARRNHKAPVRKVIPEVQHDNDTSLIVSLKTAKRRHVKLQAKEHKKQDDDIRRNATHSLNHNDSINSCNLTPNQPLEKENSYYASKTQVSFGRPPMHDLKLGERQ